MALTVPEPCLTADVSKVGTSQASPPRSRLPLRSEASTSTTEHLKTPKSLMLLFDSCWSAVEGALGSERSPYATCFAVGKVKNRDDLIHKSC